MENFHESSKNDFPSAKKSKKGKSEVSRETEKSVSVRRPWLAAAALGALAITGGMASGGVDAAGIGLSGRRSEGPVLHPYLDTCPSNSSQVYQDSYSQLGVCSLTENMEHLSMGRRDAEIDQGQHSDVAILHKEMQKFVQDIKNAFQHKEFIEKILEYISNNNDMAEKIIKGVANPSDRMKLQEMLSDPIKREIVAEELSKNPKEEVDEILKDPRVKKLIDNAYDTGFHKGERHVIRQAKTLGAIAVGIGAWLLVNPGERRVINPMPEILNENEQN